MWVVNWHFLTDIITIVSIVSSFLVNMNRHYKTNPNDKVRLIMYFCLLLQYLVTPHKHLFNHYLESKQRQEMRRTFIFCTSNLLLHFQHEASSDSLKLTRELTKSTEQWQIIYNYLWFQENVDCRRKKSKGKRNFRT